MSEKEIENDKQQALDKEEKENEQIREMGELTLDQKMAASQYFFLKYLIIPI